MSGQRKRADDQRIRGSIPGLSDGSRLKPAGAGNQAGHVGAHKPCAHLVNRAVADGTPRRIRSRAHGCVPLRGGARGQQSA